MSEKQHLEGSSSCGGCAVGFMIVIVAAVLFAVLDESDFYLMPGEANMSTDALQKTFNEIDRIVPDSLIITDELEPFSHYQSAESFGNLYYVVNPVLDAAAKADTSRKYKFQYLARVDHVDANEFMIRDFLVDSIWRYRPFVIESKNPFTD